MYCSKSTNNSQICVIFLLDSMENNIKCELGTTTLSPIGTPKEGTISHGQAYQTDFGPIFVKCNSSPQVLCVVFFSQ